MLVFIKQMTNGSKTNKPRINFPKKLVAAIWKALAAKSKQATAQVAKAKPAGSGRRKARRKAPKRRRKRK